MKNSISLFIFLLSSGLLFSQIINIPDPIFKSRLIEEGVDTNNDGEIQESEALARTSINVSVYGSGPKIENLEGIQYFTNLTGFSCAGNLLTNLDLSSLTSLISMNARNNQLVSINLNGLTQFESLWISNNLLESIDVSSLQNLRWLWCSNNQISNLDISSNLNLTAFWASDNQISTLNLLPLTLLEEIELNNNNLTDINVNHLENLTWLYLNNNLLTNIDVTNLSNLLSLDVGSNFLSELDCSTTGAELIHCQNNPDLISINVQNGVISYSDPDMLWYGFLFYDLPSLNSICMDSNEWVALSYSGYNPDNVTIFTGPDCTLSVNEFSLNETYIYPNPVSNSLIIQSNTEISNFSLHDITGKLIIKTQDVDQLKNEVFGLITGIYILKLESILGNQKIIRLVKK